MTTLKTADLYDDHAEQLSIAAPIFRDYGKKTIFHGEIVTVKVFEDNVLVKQKLGEDGTGKVLVVDGGGSLRCALMGDNLAALAIKNNWAGLVIYGCIRDAADIEKMEIGVKALNTIPAKSIKKGEGDINLLVTFAGISFKPGDFLYADEDGIVVAGELFD